MKKMKQLNGSLLCFLVTVVLSVSFTTCQCDTSTDLERYYAANDLLYRYASTKREFCAWVQCTLYEENICQKSSDPFLKGIVPVFPKGMQ